MKRSWSFVLASFLFLSVSWVWATETFQPAANVAMPLLQEGSGARAAAMANSYVGVAEGTLSLFWNPAGLGTLGQGEIALHHEFGLGYSIQETFVYGTPIGSGGGVAASFNYLTNGNFTGYDAAGDPTSSYTAGSLGGRLGWGKQWVPGLCTGLAVKFDRQDLADKSYSLFALDLGLLLNPFGTFQLGAVYGDIGDRLAGSPLSSGPRLGASYRLDLSRDNQLLLALSTDLMGANGLDHLNLGFEETLFHFFSLSGGYQEDWNSPNLLNSNGLTAGMGLYVRDLQLQFAYVPMGDLGNSQRMSVTFQFPK